VLSEQGLEEYGAPTDESCIINTKLDNSVSRGAERGAKGFRCATDVVGKEARNLGEPVNHNKPLCMKQWLTQVRELEKVLVQDS
jgi:hypothetical protein